MDLQHSSTPSSEPAVVPHLIAGEALDTHSPSAPRVRAWWRTAWATHIALIMILLLGGYFRTLGLTTWDSGTGQHPDERFFTDVASLVRVPASPREYFDSARSPGNPRNVGKTFFVYGSFPIAFTRLVAVTLTPNAAMAEMVPDLTIPLNADTGTRPQIPNPELAVPKLTPLQLIFNPEGNNLTNYHEMYKVGRSLAALFDLGSILMVFLIGQCLFDRRVGLLAALLAALAVMPIQQSHFFVDPTFSTFFALMALYWAVRMAQGGGIGVAMALGVSIGLGMATRATLATLGLVAVVAAVQAALGWCARPADRSGETAIQPGQRSFITQFLSYNFPLLFLAGVLTLFTFRVFQPDAFVGSTPTSPAVTDPHTGIPTRSSLDFMRGWGFFDVRLDPRYVSNLREVQQFVTGEIDFYPSQQWVRRADYWFPWKNMVVWGMGPALGLTVWAGWLLFGLRVLNLGAIIRTRARSLQHLVANLPHPALLLWIWIGFYFAWQGRQFAATLRYMLPIYGSLIIFGAWLLLTLWDSGRQRTKDEGRTANAAHVERRTQAGQWVRTGAQWVPLLVLLCTLGWAYAFTRIYTQPHSRVIAARWVLAHVPPGSKIISESWDDALPLAVDGGDPWGNTYRGITSYPYGEDDLRKYVGTYNAQGEFEPGLLDQLAEADYITLTSNRVYGSTVRLPMRYPATMRYYHYLFSGELGYELAADITSYPKIFGFRIPDQIAEEAFTVYDHPRVLIFRKTDSFSRERAEELITGDVNWGEVYKIPVSVADQTATALRLTESEWPAYRAAGTWSAFFNHNSLNNTFAPLIWLLVLELLGLAAFALLFHLLPWLPDRGFALARTLGLLLVAYGAWLLGSLKLLPFSPQSVWLCALPLLAIGAWVAWRSRSELLAFWRERRTALITAEAIYLLAFGLLLLIRWFNPDLWHPARGGEKPMDFAYLNAVLKSAAFPPYDPWFAGGYINYYYFGFVIVGTLIHLTRVEPALAYNLAVPTLFALTALGAWGAVYNLLAPHSDQQQPEVERRARFSALLAPLFVVLLGNLAQAIWLINGYAAQQEGRSEWAFWDATRIVNGTVNEFPFFTFLFADLHAHMIVIPFSLAVVGLTVALARWASQEPLRRSGDPQPDARFPRLTALLHHLPFVGMLLLLGLLLGTLRVTNTWDYPTYAGLSIVTLGMACWWRFRRQTDPAERRPAWNYFVMFVAAAGVMIGLSTLLFKPFIQNFLTESSGADLWREGLRSNLLEQIFFAPRTTIREALRMYGLWLFLLTSAGLLLMYRRLRLPAWLVGGIGGGLLLLTLVSIIVNVAALILLVPLLIGTAVLALRFRSLPPRMLLPLLWAGTALALTVMVEVVVVRGDVGRMNTVFKFGIHSWTLFGLAAAVAVPWIWSRLAAQNMSPVLHWSWTGAAGLLIVAALAYPLTAVPARIADRFPGDPPHTLDGMEFMRQANYTQNGQEFPLSDDAAAITWLQQHITGTPVILEAHLPSYQWAGRIATFTGLPTVLGWEWHQIQQRNAVQAGAIVNHRQNVILEIYNDTDVEQAWQHIQDYGIEYIYIGGVEQAIYEPAGIAKFATLTQQGRIEVVFARGTATIYRVRQPGTPTMLTTDLAVVPPRMETPPPLLLDQPVNELPAVGGYVWNRWASSNSWLAVLTWLGALYILALLGLPLAVTVFGGWRDGGLVWARLLGLLLLGYAVWLPTSFAFWHYNALGIFGGFLLVLALNAGLLIRLGQRENAAETSRSDELEQTPFAILVSQFKSGIRILWRNIQITRRDMLIGEGLFLGGFILFVLIRAFNPDLWHPIWGGEKPMEFGFLNAILRSPVMPPLDPFFSNGYINYYYYGIYLVSLPIKLTGIDPAVAFNLVIPTLFGLTLAGGYALVAQITGRVRYGLAGAAFLTVLGNLATIVPIGWADGLRPVFAALSKAGLAGLGNDLGTWYIGPSRVIDPPHTINEFPFWSFLFADLHPHLIALPISLLAIALAWELLRHARSAAHPGRIPLFVLTALTLGTLAVTNSWDFPTYSLLILAALFGAAWRSNHRDIAWLALGRALLLAGVLAIGGMALYMPFFDHFYALVSGIGRVRNGTSAPEYLVVYGLFSAVLLPVAFGAIWRLLPARRRRVTDAQRPDATEQASMSDLLLTTADTPVPEQANNPTPTHYISLIATLINARWLVVAIVVTLLLFTLLQPVLGLQLWLALLFASGAVVLLQRRTAPATWFAFLLATLAWAVSLGIEIIFIGDHLVDTDAYRMNTVFKFGMQIWTLMALAAASSLPLLLRGLRRVGGVPLQMVGMGGLGALIAATALFPLVGIPNRIANRFPVTIGPTLDGLAFLDQATFSYDCEAYRGCEPGVSQLQIDLRPDAAAIDWLNRNITGTPIVLQSNLWFYRAYGVRIAANTGLPTVISALHVNEQRDPAIAQVRNSDIDTLYRTTDLEKTLRLLAKYSVNYVYVGSIEHAFYNQAGLAKFKEMNGIYLDQVYSNPGVEIYRVRDLPSFYADPEQFDFTAAEQAAPPRPPAPVNADEETDAEPVAAPRPVAPIPTPADLPELEEQVAANPTDSSLVFGLAERYRSLGRLDDAVRVLEVAAEANPGDIGLHHLWGDTLSQAGRYAEAEKVYTLAARTSPTAGNWNKLGTALLQWGELDKAEIALSQALTIDDRASEPYYRLGQLYHRRGNNEQALQALKAYLELDPNGPYQREVQQLIQQIRN